MARQTECNDREVVPTDEEASLFEQVGNWLESNDWNCEAYSLRRPVVCNADWRIIVDCTETTAIRRVLIYSIFPIRIPAAQRRAVAEFMTRANYGPLPGNFELDFEDGHARFRTAADVADSEMTDAMIERLLAANLYSSGRYLPARLGVAFGTLDPARGVGLSELQVEGSLQ